MTASLDKSRSLFRVHPFIGASHFNRHIRNPKMQRFAVGRAAVLG
jgi:hypothetical protein